MSDENEIDNVPIAVIIDEMMEDMELTDKILAVRLGYSSPSMIRMFREGRVKVPFEKIPDLADAIGANRRRLMDRALREYLPELIGALLRTHSALTDNELAIVECIRQLSDGGDPSLDDEGVKSGLQQVFSATTSGGRYESIMTRGHPSTCWRSARAVAASPAGAAARADLPASSQASPHRYPLRHKALRYF